MSLFHHLALAPSEGPDLVAIAVTLAAALALACLAIVLYDRRDLSTG